MRVLRAVTFIFVICSSCLLFAQTQRKVNLNWGKVKGAKSYDIEITRLYPANPPFKTVIKVKNTSYELQLTPGDYQMRTRSVLKNGTKGPWSGAATFPVKFPALEITSPSPGQTITPNSAGKVTSVSFKWRGNSEFEGYEFSIFDKRGVKVFSKIVKGTSIKAPLNINSSYRWTVYGLLRGKTYSSKHDTALKFSIEGRSLEGPRSMKLIGDPVRGIQWNKVKNARRYSVIINRKSKKGRFQTFKKKSTRRTSYLFGSKLPVGSYKVDVTSSARGFRNSIASSIYFNISKKEKMIIEKIVAPKGAPVESIPKVPIQAIDSWMIGLGAAILTTEESTPSRQEKGKGFSGGAGILLGALPSLSGGFFLDLLGEIQVYKVNNEVTNFYRAHLGAGYMLSLGKTNFYLSGGYFLWQFPQVNSPSVASDGVSLVSSPGFTGFFGNLIFEMRAGRNWTVSLLAGYHLGGETSGAYNGDEIDIDSALDIGIDTTIQWSESTRVFFRVSRQAISGAKDSALFDPGGNPAGNGSSELDHQNFGLNIGLNYGF